MKYNGGDIVFEHMRIRCHNRPYAGQIDARTIGQLVSMYHCERSAYAFESDGGVVGPHRNKLHMGSFLSERSIHTYALQGTVKAQLFVAECWIMSCMQYPNDLPLEYASQAPCGREVKRFRLLELM